LGVAVFIRWVGAGISSETSFSMRANRPLIAICTLAHAAIVTGLWVASMYRDVRVVSGPVWALIAWAWLVWPLLLAVSRANSSRLTLGAVAMGALIIAPTVPEIYAFTAWSVRGFAS
jgi:hypothetical protein